MKKIILAILVISSSIVYGQNSTRDSLILQVDQYAKNTNKAAEIFLNKKLSPEERIKAIEPYDMIYDEKQVEQFKAIVFDDNETAEVRAIALNKIYQFVLDGEKIQALTTEWLGNPQTPKVLRYEALDLAGNLSFSSMDAPDIYQKMLEDPEYEFRLFAFSRLVIHGDARAQQKLIDGLENPQLALLPAPAAIGVLSMAPKREFYPTLYKIMQQTKDEATRLEAIRQLGFYKEARQKLIAISRNPNEKEQFREAALEALYAGDRENVVQYVTPILSDKSALPSLQIIGIQMTIDVRQSITYRAKAKHVDNYDLLIERIAKDKSKDPELQNIALNYIQSVRPKY
jgi:HEAT repeat protein